jgi:hypothetical protein
MPTDHSHIKSRALEMFQTGQGADCVIQVMPQMDGQDSEKKVFFLFLLVHCALFSGMPLDSMRNSKVRISKRVSLTEQ